MMMRRDGGKGIQITSLLCRGSLQCAWVGGGGGGGGGGGRWERWGGWQMGEMGRVADG